jgi:hypothetical protein
MTSEEMANDEIKKQREKFDQEGINDSRLAQVEVRQPGSNSALPAWESELLFTLLIS